MRPGRQEAGDARAACWRPADLFLAPYADGVSTRRTTLMAALQHGLCIVATEGTTPEGALGEPAMAKVPVSDYAAFAAEARGLARDRAARERHGLAARTLYDELYSWRALAGEFVRAISARGGPLPR